MSLAAEGNRLQLEKHDPILSRFLPCVYLVKLIYIYLLYNVNAYEILCLQ